MVGLGHRRIFICMKKIAIINCVNKKQLHAMEAQQLYVSMAFNAKIKFIKQIILKRLKVLNIYIFIFNDSK